MMNQSSAFTVLVPVYWGDDPTYATDAIESVMRQTLAPSEVLVVRDGPVTDEVGNALQILRERYSSIFRELPLPRNLGLGLALRAGIKEASHEIIARMDADDLSDPTRFEKQMRAMENDKDLALIGAQINEFVREPGDLDIKRRVPTDEAAIRTYARLRNPLNHMTVMYRRSAVLDAGNYVNSPWFEDYHLWVRMLMGGHRLRNLDESLVDVRVSPDLYRRRGGLGYLRSELAFRRTLADWGFVTPVQALASTVAVSGVRLAPNWVRQAVYTKLLRQGGDYKSGLASQE